MNYVPKEHEKCFKMNPVGIAYTCEFCNEGEMIAHITEPIVPNEDGSIPLIPHLCNKCGKEMFLPRAYPYIEWERDKVEHMLIDGKVVQVPAKE